MAGVINVVIKNVLVRTRSKYSRRDMRNVRPRDCCFFIGMTAGGPCQPSEDVARRSLLSIPWIGVRDGHSDQHFGRDCLAIQFRGLELPLLQRSDCDLRIDLFGPHRVQIAQLAVLGDDSSQKDAPRGRKRGIDRTLCRNLLNGKGWREESTAGRSWTRHCILHGPVGSATRIRHGDIDGVHSFASPECPQVPCSPTARST